ncbi:MAG: hypothetical protein ABIH99_05125 [Candidatus Micrarchaeota archaeon]
MEIDYKYIAYASIGLGLISLLLTITGGAGTLVIVTGPLAAFFFFATIVMYKYGYMVIPLFTRGARIVEVHDGGYELPPGQEAITRKTGNAYYATMFLMLKVYESVTDKSSEEVIAYNEYFERAISSVKFVTKFCMMVYVKDLSSYREKIETRRAEAQLRLARERDKPDPDVLRIDKYEREVAMWDAQLGRLASGVKPMASVAYVMTTAAGVTKEAALAGVKAQSNELRATIANALNVEVVPLAGEDMKRCFEWELMLPPLPQNLEASVAGI